MSGSLTKTKFIKTEFWSRIECHILKKIFATTVNTRALHYLYIIESTFVTVLWTMLWQVLITRNDGSFVLFCSYFCSA